MKRSLFFAVPAAVVFHMSIASAHPYVAAVFTQFADGSVESKVIAKGSRQICEKALKDYGEPGLEENRKAIRIWLEVYRAASAMGQE
jgi:hypothetical protein